MSAQNAEFKVGQTYTFTDSSRMGWYGEKFVFKGKEDCHKWVCTAAFRTPFQVFNKGDIVNLPPEYFSPLELTSYCACCNTNFAGMDYLCESCR